MMRKRSRSFGTVATKWTAKTLMVGHKKKILNNQSERIKRVTAGRFNV